MASVLGEKYILSLLMTSLASYPACAGTLVCPVDSSIISNWMSPFQI